MGVFLLDVEGVTLVFAEDPGGVALVLELVLALLVVVPLADAGRCLADELLLDQVLALIDLLLTIPSGAAETVLRGGGLLAGDHASEA